jgi:flagellar biosynthesis protein FlhF
VSSFKPVGVEVTAATDTYALTSPTSTRESRIKQYANSPVGGATTYPVDQKKRPVPGANSLNRRYMITNAYADERDAGLNAEKKILFSLYQQLVSHDVDSDIATDITESLKLIPDASHRLAQGDLKSLLAGILEHMGVISKPIEFENSRARVVAFIGTTGAGKTTTIAKLAAHFAIDQNKDVAMITLDDLRIAAIDQIKACANIIGIPLEVASNSSDLKKHIKRHRQKDLILIDTPGFNQKNNDQIMELQGYFKKLNTIETQLVLSATTKEKDLLDTVKRFENMGTNRLTFTRIDESNTVGNLLNVLIRTTLPGSMRAIRWVIC